jgi:hypothetical protein
MRRLGMNTLVRTIRRETPSKQYQKRRTRGTPPPVELQKYHESALDSEDNVPCTRNRVGHETKVY